MTTTLSTAAATRNPEPPRRPQATGRPASHKTTRTRSATAKRTRRPHTPLHPRPSIPLTLVTGLVLLYTLLPLAWLVINATKDQKGLLDSFGLWFADESHFWDNISRTLAYDDGVFVRWLLNTLLYVTAGAGGATVLAVLGGYALAKYDFPGRKAVFAVVIGAVAVPGTALAVPTFLMFSNMGLTNTPWAVIIPSLISPFGLYLMWVFAAEAVPTELLEAARIDGSGELRTFFTIALPLLMPGTVTVLLFSMVATWNNYFLPLIMIKDPDWYPL
ncbi:carbohydrate ABC transporter permease, partial [Streptomyces wedmorensis]|uniref:carbohydrate ABC transporter permease n=1 Tax=Streptomyces wedmorensis TaxID=43759 RepID=UPI003438CCD9